MAARMRNYAAMLDGKLLQCVRELEAGSGDAWERCIQKGGSPGQDLAVARREALSRGLIHSSPSQPPPRAAPPGPTLGPGYCRICNGDGVDPKTPPRAADTARLVFHLLKPETHAAPTFPRGSRPLRGKPWRGNVSADVQQSSTTYAGPLMSVLALANDRLANGFELVECDLPDAAVACHHCEGSGRCKHRCCRT